MNYGLLVVFFITSFTLSAQVDNVLWAGTQIRKKFDDKWSLQLQPIVRYSDNFSTYQNASLDISLRRNLGNNLFAGVISRTWSMPNGPDRQFIWLDFGHGFKIPELQLSVSNRVRYHLALDNGIVQQDYIRYSLLLVPTTSWKLKPTLAIEPWFILNDIDVYRTHRIEPGLRYQFNKTFGLTTIWRREVDKANDVTVERNLWVVAVVYNLK